jgi:hypothetical protein
MPERQPTRVACAPGLDRAGGAISRLDDSDYLNRRWQFKEVAEIF